MTELERTLTSTIDRLLTQIEELNQQNQDQTHQIQRLTEQVEYLTRKLFGRSSEKRNAVNENQLSLFDNDFFEESETTEEQTVEEEISYRRKKRKGFKADLVKHLPAELIYCDLTEKERECLKCGHEMNLLGENKIREEVHFIPAKLYKKVFIQRTYGCVCHDEACESRQIKSAEVPKAPIQRSLAGASLLAWVYHQKFDLSIPTYRQEDEWKMAGLEVTRRTLSNWIIVTARDWLNPIYELLHQKLRQEQVLHSDETPYQILRRSDGKPATSESRIWVLRTTKDAPRPIIFYHSDLTRKQSVAEKLLTGFRGYLHCDGYVAYKNLPNIELVGCWAHVRRKFFDVCGKHGKGYAKTGLDYCNQIFKIEKEIINLEPSKKQEKRTELTKPLIEEFYAWLGSFPTMKGKLQDAVKYAFSQRTELTAFLKDGQLQASNNLCEERIRPFAIGRKNFLFSTSEAGATANAMAYTIMETAKANGLNTFKYLNYLFENLPNLAFHQDRNLLESFLPWAKNVQLECK